MRKVIAKAPGKCILFGEHFVVYGTPAIAAAISNYSKCTIEEIVSGIQLKLNNYNKLYEFQSFNEIVKENFPEFEEIIECFRIFKERHGINFENIKITINSSLFMGSGLGSSASMAVSLVAAINSYYDINLDRSQISDIALEMEKIIHGTPSGIDNTTCTFGNVLFYQKGEHRFLTVPSELPLLVTNTNIERKTKEAIELVRKYTIENAESSRGLFRIFNMMISNIEEALVHLELQRIGGFMSDNQELLVNFGVSNDVINEITQIALKNGAFGSKLTGAGLGGCVISIGTQETLQKISEILKSKGYPSFIANIDNEGVKVETE